MRQDAAALGSMFRTAGSAMAASMRPVTGAIRGLLAQFMGLIVLLLSTFTGRNL